MMPFRDNHSGETNKIVWRNHERRQAKTVIGAWNRLQIMMEKHFQTNMLCFCFEFVLRKVAIVSEDFTGIGSGFQIVCTATEKARK